jgi:hypothetical protein
MNTYLATAAGLAILIGLVHSILGERMVFSRLRQGTVVPAYGGTLLRGHHVRILWATWHIVTLLGWAVAAALLLLAAEASPSPLHIALLQVIALAMAASGVLVLVGTKARHPGWIGLLGVSVLTWLGLPA